MALITNNISGSSVDASKIGITGSVIISNRGDANFPSLGSDTVFFVSGSESSKSVFGGAAKISGSLATDGNVTLGDSSSDTLIVAGISAFQMPATFGAGLSGSLTKLSDGTSYLIAGSNVSISSASNGAITISSTASGGGGGDITSVVAGTGLIGGATSGDATLSINDSVVATISGSTFMGATNHLLGLSGSLTRLTNGTSYLVAGTRMMITTGSTGAVTVSHSGSINVTEALTIGATTTAPTKATTRVQDFIQLTDDGSGWCRVEASYFAASPSGAAGGSGNYLYTLPGGYQFDTTIHPTNTQLTTLSGWEQVNKMIGATGIVSQEGNSSFNNYVVPYSSTQFRIIAHSPSQYAYLGSSYYLMTVANNQFRLSFRFKKA